MKSFAVISLFPDVVSQTAKMGVTGRAFETKKASLLSVHLRAHAVDARGTVDDRPFGGGPGMVLKPEPMKAAIEAAKSELPTGAKVVFMTPQGRRFDNALAKTWAADPSPLIFVAGRYEGIDHRVIEAYADECVSLGDFVLSGGELAALTMIDAVLRYVPGVLGHEASAANDSFENGLLDYPVYTRPQNFEGREVPEVLTRGDHKAIDQWRRSQQVITTAKYRPDLLGAMPEPECNK